MEIYHYLKNWGRNALIAGGLTGMLYTSQPSSKPVTQPSMQQTTHSSTTQPSSKPSNYDKLLNMAAKAYSDYSKISKYENKAPPELAAETWLNSKPLKLDDLKGKVVVLDFFGIWCGPCMAEISDYEELWQKHKDELVVIGMHSSGIPLEHITKVAEKRKLNFPIAVDRGKQHDVWNGETFQLYGIQAVPQRWLIDKRGKVRTDVSLKQLLEEKVEIGDEARK